MSGQVPLVSVVIPTYNRAEYAVAAVESVLAQTHPKIECVVVDDGSTDATPEALAPFEDRIVLHRQENRGLAGARNAGIRLATGDFVGFLDSDDVWLPRLVTHALEIFARYPEVGALFLAEREMSADGKPLQRVHTKKSPGSWFTPQGMIGRDTGVGSGRPPIVRAPLFAEHGLFDESFRNDAVDCSMWIPWSFHVPMAIMGEPLVLRRVHEGHVSGDQVKDARAWLRILDRVLEEQPDFCRKFAKVMQRTRGKQHLRIGRELLARTHADPDLIGEARENLQRAISLWPRFARAWVYLAWSYLAPQTYGAVRETERRRR